MNRYFTLFFSLFNQVQEAAAMQQVQQSVGQSPGSCGKGNPHRMSNSVQPQMLSHMNNQPGRQMMQSVPMNNMGPPVANSIGKPNSMVGQPANQQPDRSLPGMEMWNRYIFVDLVSLNILKKCYERKSVYKKIMWHLHLFFFTTFNQQ